MLLSGLRDRKRCVHPNSWAWAFVCGVSSHCVHRWEASKLRAGLQPAVPCFLCLNICIYSLFNLLWNISANFIDVFGNKKGFQ